MAHNFIELKHVEVSKYDLFINSKKPTVIAGVHGSRHSEQGARGPREVIKKGVPVQFSPD